MENYWIGMLFAILTAGTLLVVAILFSVLGGYI